MILKEHCKNMTQAKEYINNILNSFNNGESIEDRTIQELLPYHPTKQIDVNNIAWLKMKPRPPFGNLALFYKYKNSNIEDDISYYACIENLYEKYDYEKQHKKDVISAFRNESHIGTKKQFFINNTTIENHIYMGICNNCKKKTKNITTDHYELPFKKILNNFIELNKINLCNIDVFENKDNEIRIKDKNLASKWLNYHDNKAHYRMLCGPCNSHFGSYGYRSK